MRMMRITIPTALVVIQFGVALAVAGLIGWRLGGPAETPTQPEAPRSERPPLGRAGETDNNPAPAPEFERDSAQIQKRFDDIQERMARAESSMPAPRERQVDPVVERRKAIEEAKRRESGDRWRLDLPIYIVPVPAQ